MKQLINLLGVIFLILSLVVIAVTSVMSFVNADFSSGRVILQIVIAVCAAVIGVIHIVIAAIISKRA